MNKTKNMRNPGHSKDNLLRICFEVVLALIIVCSQLVVAHSTEGEKTDRDKAGFRGLIKTVATRDARPLITIDQYDPSGKLVKTIVKDAQSGAIQLRIVVDIYNAQERRVRETTYTSTGAVRSQIKYLYDASGQHMVKIWLDKDGTLEDATFIRFDSSGKAQEEIAMDVVNGTMRKKTYTYDASGNRITEVAQTGTELREVANSYNDKQLLVEQMVKTSGDKIFKSVFTHDSEGNVVSHENYSGEGALLDKWAFAYEYDSHRNWTKVTTNFLMRNGSPISESTETKRTITYYQKDGR